MSLPNFIERRILTEDARSLVFERLHETAIAKLYRWFTSPTGGDDGEALLRELPVLDTLVDMGSRRLPGKPAPSPICVALDQFCCGLLIGALLQDTAGEDTPFYDPLDVEDVMFGLREAGPTLHDLAGLHLTTDSPRIELSRIAHSQWPEAQAMLLVTHRLARANGPRCQRNRLHFYVGLLAAGIEFKNPAHSSPLPIAARKPVQGQLFVPPQIAGEDLSEGTGA